MSDEDKRILEKMNRGDHTGFDDCFRAYYKYLVTIAYSYTKDFELSKDLAQEVFVDFWKRKSEINISTSLKAFLKRAVIYQSLSAIKKAGKMQGGTDVLEVGDGADSTNELIDANELGERVNEIIDALPDRCREVFMLSRFQQLSHKEISEKLDISTKTIENQITKALKTLREGLKAEYIFGLALILSKLL